METPRRQSEQKKLPWCSFCEWYLKANPNSPKKLTPVTHETHECTRLQFWRCSLCQSQGCYPALCEGMCHDPVCSVLKICSTQRFPHKKGTCRTVAKTLEALLKNAYKPIPENKKTVSSMDSPRDDGKRWSVWCPNCEMLKKPMCDYCGCDGVQSDWHINVLSKAVTCSVGKCFDSFVKRTDTHDEDEWLYKVKANATNVCKCGWKIKRATM